MNIAFDLHGTLDTHRNIRKLFWLTVRSHASGTNVFIISGPPEDEIREKLINVGILATTPIHIISVVDYLKRALVEFTLDENDEHWCQKGLWWASKGAICREYKIDILFDDKIEYKAHMPKHTSFIHIT